MVEALLFASASPLSDEDIAGRLPGAADVPVIMARLCERYAGRGVEVCKVADRWTLRTAPDLGFLLETEKVEQRKLSRAALETLAIIAYHQPATRAEIEEVRGVAVSKGTLDLLLEIGWIKIAGRRRAPGKPVTYATSDGFLEHFGLESVEHLPGLDELKAAGLLDGRLPPDFSVPAPKDAPDADLGADAEDGEEPPDFASDFLEGEADDAG
ncbi:MAG: SMC-Scp complex subunit ScpB [Pseudomonadota bacterium]